MGSARARGRRSPTAGYMAHVRSREQFFADADSGNLPSFCIVDPDFRTFSGETPQDIPKGESCSARWREEQEIRGWFGEWELLPPGLAHSLTGAPMSRPAPSGTRSTTASSAASPARIHRPASVAVG